MHGVRLAPWNPRWKLCRRQLPDSPLGATEETDDLESKILKCDPAESSLPDTGHQ
jgi:hypothetical protein